MDADGTNRRLLGVHRSGGEFMCAQGHGIRDGSVDDAAIKAIADWNANTVRIPLSAECRLGLSDIKPEYGGANYMDAVKDLVTRMKAQGRPNDPAGNLAAAWSGPDRPLRRNPHVVRHRAA